MFAQCFLLECLTNLHVGSGDVNFNIVDNEVERDPVTGFPTINASGVKGALREFFVSQNAGVALIDDAFGKAASKADSKSSAEKGNVKILSANMLALAMRATDKKATYYVVSNDAAIKYFNNLFSTLPVGKNTIDSGTDVADGRQAEGKALEKKYTYCEKIFYTMSENDFSSVSLPVLARNQLENGTSKNLWYEEIVPHDSLFYFFALADSKELLDDFADAIKDKVVQFGGNASIGYGLCKVTEV